MITVKNNQMAIQDTFEKPLMKHYPEWLVKFVPATYDKPPFVIWHGREYQFERP
ncbi:hypothetical protein [Vibrio furnissii]|nr:hypothetical protein [Vibrio furnissii]UHJ62948.1 hypothetical protein LUM42_18255 [Vibrio furnissii]